MGGRESDPFGTKESQHLRIHSYRLIYKYVMKNANDKHTIRLMRLVSASARTFHDPISNIDGICTRIPMQIVIPINGTKRTEQAALGRSG